MSVFLCCCHSLLWTRTLFNYDMEHFLLLCLTGRLKSCVSWSWCVYGVYIPPVQSLFRRAREVVPHHATEQSSLGEPLLLDQESPGHMIFSPTRVAVLLGNANCIFQLTAPCLDFQRRTITGSSVFVVTTSRRCRRGIQLFTPPGLPKRKRQKTAFRPTSYVDLFSLSA